MSQVADNRTLRELEKRLPELAADLENDHYDQELRVEIAAQAAPAELDLIMTVHNSKNSKALPMTVGLEDGLFRIDIGQDKSLNVETLESVFLQMKSVVGQSVAAW
jgi:hypothetical protein